MASLKDYNPHKAPKSITAPKVNYPPLSKVLSLLPTEEEVDLFLRTLCVDQEYINLNQRLKIAYYLRQGYTYQKIVDTLHCSIRTISYINKRMSSDSVGFDNLFAILEQRGFFIEDPTTENTNDLLKNSVDPEKLQNSTDFFEESFTEQSTKSKSSSKNST